MKLDIFVKNGSLVLFSLSLFLSIFFLVGVVSGATSTTETEFNIPGCTFNFEGNSISVAAGSCYRGADAEGELYCGGDSDPWVTRELGLGCAMGNSGYQEGVGDSSCCPSNEGLFCNDTGVANGFRCDTNPDDCSEQTTPEDCEDSNCFWFGAECLDGPGELGCFDYTDPDDCNNDPYDFSSGGVGSENCGGFVYCDGENYIIDEEGCGCAWNGDAGECQVEMTISQFIPSGATSNTASCSNSFTVSEDCIDGQQALTWYSVVTPIEGTVPDLCLEAIGCTDGEDTRYCGESVVKLPGFSLFSLFVSLFIIGIYYFLTDRFKYKRAVKLL